MIRSAVKNLLLLVLILSFINCARKGKSKFRERVVPITINVKPGNNHQLRMINWDVFLHQLKQDLQQFQNVELELVEADESPQIVLDLNIVNFNIWPKNEQISRRVFRRTVQAGTDAQGRPIYQTITASVDITQIKIRSNAHFKAKLTFKDGQPTEVFERSFVPNYVYNNITTGNIQGDQRAVDPSILAARDTGIEPREEDFLILLARVEMNRRLSNEIRKKYQ